jgi:hypothetical protein
MRDLKIIYDGDMTNRKPEVEFAKRAYEISTTIDRDREKAKDNIRHMTRMDRIQLQSAFQQAHGLGKKKAAFRQVAYKPKGQVFSGHI